MFEQFVKKYSHAAMRSPVLLLLGYALFTVLCVYLATRLRLETDLADLLPEDAPSVIARDEARARTTSTDQFLIAVESTNALANVRFVDALTEALSDWDEVVAFEKEQDNSFYRDRALLLLPVEDLQRVKERLQRLIRRRLGENNPLFIDLEREDDDEQARADAEADGQDPADAEFEQRWRELTYWIQSSTLDELGFTESEAENLFPFFARDDASAAPSTTSSTASTRAPMVVPRSELPEGYRDYRLSGEGRVALLVVRLKEQSTDVDYARAAYDRGMAAIAELNPASFHPDMRADVVGAYRGFLEVKAVARDVNKATLISLGLVVLIIAGFFRSVRSIFIVMLPLLIGIAWTAGLMQLLFGRVSTLTAFVFAMLIGMGIDFAIHLYSRIKEEWGAGRSWEEAIEVSVTSTGRSLVSATATTVVALLTLLLASFDGFQEFGVACGAGVGICLVTTLLIVPVLVGLTEAVWPLKRPAQGAGATRTGARVPVVERGMRFACVGMVLLAVASAAVIGRVEFEYDFGNLRAPSEGRLINYNSAIGSRRGSTPVVILGENEAQMREVHAYLRERLGTDDQLKSFRTIETLVPSDQDARMEVINEIYEVLDRRAVQNIDGEEGELIQAITGLTEVEPFEGSDLPEWVRRELTERDGTFGSIGQLYGRYDRWHALEVAEFQETYGSITVPSGQVLLASNSFIVADVMRYVQADGVKLAVYVSLALLVVLLLDFRGWRGPLVCLLTLGTGVLLTVGLMVIFDIKLGLYNMVVLPTVLGTGIDGAIHLYHRYVDDPERNMVAVMRTTGVAVLASSVTTVAGFVGLLFVQHEGVITIGALSVAGIVSSMVAALVLLPGLLLLIPALSPPVRKPSA
jgi:predicted RND superfamily exporter protein